MKKLLILLCFTIVGCDRKEKDPTRSVFNPTPVEESAPAPEVPPGPQPQLDLGIDFPSNAEFFLAMGQSNMSGEAGGDFPDNPNVIAAGYGNIGRKGIAYGFGIYMYQGRTVAILNCAIGGTPMSQWQYGSALYNSCIRLAKAKGVGKISGVIFDQGQQDSNFNYPSQWASMFTGMVEGLREDLENQNLPVVFGQIGQYGNNSRPPHYDHIRAQQASVSMSNVVMVTQDDVAPQCGGWHYCQPEMLIVGERFAKQMNQMSFSTREKRNKNSIRLF